MVKRSFEIIWSFFTKYSFATFHQTKNNTHHNTNTCSLIPILTHHVTCDRIFSFSHSLLLFAMNGSKEPHDKKEGKDKKEGDWVHFMLWFLIHEKSVNCTSNYTNIYTFIMLIICFLFFFFCLVDQLFIVAYYLYFVCSLFFFSYLKWAKRREIEKKKTVREKSLRIP